jgi:hypothetical protein
MMSASDPASVLRAHDPATGLTGRLDVLLGTDGGVAAVQVEVRNTTDHDLALRYHDDPRITVTVAVTDRAGVALNPPSPLLDTSSGGRQVERTLSPGTSLHWLVRLSDRMPLDELPAERVPARLFVAVALDVVAAGGVAADPVTVIMTMYDAQVELTR